MTTRIAVDAMGGDLAPDAVVRGALAAVERETGAVEVVLAGDEPRIRRALGGVRPAGISIVHAPDAIGMAEHPVGALRLKPRASIPTGLHLVREGRADAFFSAGSTGACVAAASMALGRLEGVRRPGIAVELPSGRGSTVLMDAGANVAPRALDLLQAAVMASAYAREVVGRAEPTVALLNVGAEADKGTELIQEAAGLLRGTLGGRFRGFVEGHDLLRGAADVVVCDGFTGNCVLKALEGQAHAMLARVRAALEALPGEAGKAAAAAALDALTPLLDWSEHNGAQLLGTSGVVVVGHGRSDARAIANGVRLAAKAARRGLGASIAHELARIAVPA